MDALIAPEVLAVRTARRLRRPTSRRRALERAGWRTWLSHQENQRRAADGRLTGVVTCWQVEAEHECGTVCAIEAGSPAAAWATVTRQAAGHRCPN